MSKDLVKEKEATNSAFCIIKSHEQVHVSLGLGRQPTLETHTVEGETQHQ